ncbi:MAG: tetratricopeptide (TPR) repeat protein, partial [Lentimonas sp.]
SYQTTYGGILLKIRTISKNGDDLNLIRKSIRSIIFGVIFLLVGQIQTQYANPLNYIIPIAVIAAIFIPSFFLKNSLTLIDLFSSSKVVLEKEGRLVKAKKYEAIIILIIAIIFTVSSSSYMFIKSTNCMKYAQQQNYQSIVEECPNVAKLTRNGYLNFIVGASYTEIEDYDNSLKYYKIAYSSGYKDAKFALANTYILLKQDYKSAIDLLEPNLNNETMVSHSTHILASAYLIKYASTNDVKDLMDFYTYADTYITISENSNDLAIKTLFNQSSEGFKKAIHEAKKIMTSDQEKDAIKKADKIFRELK